MIEESITYPSKGDDWLKRLLIGGILSMIPIVNFIVYGYFVAVLRGTVQGYDAPPRFDDYGALFVDGLKAIVIFFVYGFVPFVLLFIVSMLLGAGANAAGDAGGLFAGLGFFSLILTFVAYFAVMFIAPAALTNFARTGNIGDAFDFATIKQVVTSSDYVVAAVAAIVISFVANTVAFMLYLVLIGIILAPFIFFYVQVAAFRIFGSAYVRAMGGGQPPQQGYQQGYQQQGQY